MGGEGPTGVGCRHGKQRQISLSHDNEKGINFNTEISSSGDDEMGSNKGTFSLTLDGENGVQNKDTGMCQDHSQRFFPMSEDMEKIGASQNVESSCSNARRGDKRYILSSDNIVIDVTNGYLEASSSNTLPDSDEM